MSESSVAWIISVQAAMSVTCPNVAVLIFGQGVDDIAGQTIWIFWNAFELFQVLPIVFNQSVFRSKPHESLPVLDYVEYQSVGYSFLHEIVFCNSILKWNLAGCVGRRHYQNTSDEVDEPGLYPMSYGLFALGKKWAVARVAGPLAYPKYIKKDKQLNFLIITDCVALRIRVDKTINTFALEVTVSLFHGQYLRKSSVTMPKVDFQALGVSLLSA